jgi:hypothetical protein
MPSPCILTHEPGPRANPDVGVGAFAPVYIAWLYRSRTMPPLSFTRIRQACDAIRSAVRTPLVGFNAGGDGLNLEVL